MPDLPDNATLLQLLQSQGINFDQMQREYQASQQGQLEDVGKPPVPLPSPYEVMSIAGNISQLQSYLWSLPWLGIASFVGCVLTTMSKGNSVEPSIQHCAHSRWPTVFVDPIPNA